MERQMVEIAERSREWKNGYQLGAAHTKDRIWQAVLDYVKQHDPVKADALRADIIKAMITKSIKELECETP